MLKLFGKIVNDKFIFSTPKHKEKQLEFAKKNHGLNFEINIITINKAEHYQHRYYRGPLLESICDYFGSQDRDKIHVLEVKKRFLYYHLENYDMTNIPDLHLKKIQFIQDGDSLGYIRSTASLSIEEMNEFINKVETWLLVDLEHRIIEKYQEEAQQCKTALKSDLFDQEVEKPVETFAF